MKEPKFTKRQVVRIDTESYNTKWKNEKFQVVKKVFPWMNTKGYGCTLSNGDECHEKYLMPLTAKQIGVRS